MTIGTLSSNIRIVRLFPDLLGTYGDDGNATVLAQRARWRGATATIVDVTAGSVIPDDGDIYVIGGGEDGPQTTAAAYLADSGALDRAVDRGAGVLAICAGFQLLGRFFVGPNGDSTPGLGLLDITTHRGTGPRVTGEVVVAPDPRLHVENLTGYENHAGITRLGGDATVLGTVVVGTGSGTGSSTEGAWNGRVIGTYLHGPLLARNPQLADVLLAWAFDVDASELPKLDDRLVDDLRENRLTIAAASRDGAPAGGWRNRIKRFSRRRADA